ncbi:TPA: hypothetical protein ACH3X1_008498 [Trebouxia sp. C0004]
MELCPTATLIELFEGYTAADVKQKEDDYFVGQSSCTVDLDFSHPAIDESLIASAAVSATPLVRAESSDSNDDYDLSSLVSPGCIYIHHTLSLNIAKKPLYLLHVDTCQSDDVCFALLRQWQHSLAIATTPDENDEGLTLSPSFRLSPIRLGLPHVVRNASC